VRFTLTRVGVLLAGCGAHDGSDAGEAILTFLELERRGVKPVPLAPPGDQMHVVDHSSGDEVDGESRRMAVEAARLTRGRIEILGETPPDRLHALIVPGGSGAAKNFMSGFLQPGEERRLHPPVGDLLGHFLARRKPIGLMSVANFLLAGLVDSPVLPERAGMPAEPLVVDPERRLVWAPTFLTATSLAEAAVGVAALVELVLHYAAEARAEGA
jgi:enhancing lycopene biosynthesis protein 2